MLYILNNKIYCLPHTNIDFNKYIKYDEIKQISYDTIRVCVLTYNNNIFIFNIHTNKVKKREIDGDISIKKICICSDDILILTESSELKMFSYQNINDDYVLSTIMTDINIKNIYNCSYCIMILKQYKNNTELYCFGYIRTIGRCFGDIKYKGKKMEKFMYISFDVSHRYCSVGDNSYYLIKLHINENIKDIYPGGYHCIIQMEDNKIIGIGCNNYGQCNVNQLNIPYNKIKKISCGFNFTLLLLFDGSLYLSGISSSMTIFGDCKPKLILSDPNIYNIWTSDYYAVLLYYDGSFKILGSDIILSNDKSISYIYDSCVNVIWSPQNHHIFFEDFKKYVRVLYLILKYKQYKIPKYLYYIIIRFMI